MKFELTATKYRYISDISIQANLKIDFPFSEIFLDSKSIELEFLNQLNLNHNIVEDNIYIKANRNNINILNEYISSNDFVLFLNKKYDLNISKTLISEISATFNENIKNIDVLTILSNYDTNLINDLKNGEHEVYDFFFHKLKDRKNFSKINSLYVSTSNLAKTIDQANNKGILLKSNIRVLKENIGFKELKDLIDLCFSNFERYRINYNMTNEFHIFEIDFYFNTTNAMEEIDE